MAEAMFCLLTVFLAMADPQGHHLWPVTRLVHNTCTLYKMLALYAWS